MSVSAPQVLDHDGVRYVPEADYLQLQDRHNALKDSVSGFLEQLEEQGIQQRRVRRRTAYNVREQAAGAADWEGLTKIEGLGFDAQPGAGVVQIYRLDCGQQEQTDEQQQQTDEQQQTEHVGFLFRPRDALELLRTNPLWKADKVAFLDDKVGHNLQAYVPAG